MSAWRLAGERADEQAKSGSKRRPKKKKKKKVH